MTIPEFALLNTEQQIETIKKEGSFLSVRNKAGIDIILYQLDGFYIEVFFEAMDNDKMLIQSFDDMACLDVYLKEVNIAEIEQLLYK
jgi:hypothetical protein